MLELSNVAVELVANRSDCVIGKILIENDVKSVQDLFDIMPKYPNVDWSRYDKEIRNVLRGVRLRQKRGKEPTLYDYIEYNDSSLNYVDTLNNGDVLLLNRPTTGYTVGRHGLHILTIADIKRYLQLTDYKGDNYLYSGIKKVGPNAVFGIARVVDMYSCQVERQATLTSSREINLFTYQQDEKREIVTSKYDELITYLMDNAQELVWGELSEAQKRNYLSSITNNWQIDLLIKERMINIITNYTTLPELENVASGDYKVLKRFIKK